MDHSGDYMAGSTCQAFTANGLQGAENLEARLLQGLCSYSLTTTAKPQGHPLMTQ
jgi:hypothetical protein